VFFCNLHWDPVSDLFSSHPGLCSCVLPTLSFGFDRNAAICRLDCELAQGRSLSLFSWRVIFVSVRKVQDPKGSLCSLLFVLPTVTCQKICRQHRTVEVWQERVPEQLRVRVLHFCICSLSSIQWQHPNHISYPNRISYR
jgi:hypothetical protein